MSEQVNAVTKNWRLLAKEGCDTWLHHAAILFESMAAAGQHPPLRGGPGGATAYGAAFDSGMPADAASTVTAAGQANPFNAPWPHPWASLDRYFPGFEPVAGFGFTCQQQHQQQEMFAATLECIKHQLRYQGLLQRAQVHGLQAMQDKLAQQEEPVETIKELYDSWVNAVEDAYAKVALSDEFRETYGALSNAQMYLRQLQQQQVERWCREQGMPTRSEVAELGKRVQELRRERSQSCSGVPETDENLSALRNELAALSQRLDDVLAHGKFAPVSRTRPQRRSRVATASKSVTVKPISAGRTSRKAKP